MSENKMTLAKFLTEQGLFIPGDKKVEEMKKLSEQDRLSFAKMARDESNIVIVSSLDGTPILS